MEKKFILEHNCETGETVEREFTAAEYAQAEEVLAQVQAMEAERLAAEEAAAALKESAKAKLIAGEPLTSEEAATIVL